MAEKRSVTDRVKDAANSPTGQRVINDFEYATGFGGIRDAANQAIKKYQQRQQAKRQKAPRSGTGR